MEAEDWLVSSIMALLWINSKVSVVKPKFSKEIVAYNQTSVFIGRCKENHMTSQLPHAVFHLSVVSPEIMFVSFTNLSVVSLLE